MTSGVSARGRKAGKRWRRERRKDESGWHKISVSAAGIRRETDRKPNRGRGWADGDVVALGASRGAHSRGITGAALAPASHFSRRCWASRAPPRLRLFCLLACLHCSGIASACALLATCHHLRALLLARYCRTRHVVTPFSLQNLVATSAATTSAALRCGHRRGYAARRRIIRQGDRATRRNSSATISIAQSHNVVGDCGKHQAGCEPGASCFFAVGAASRAVSVPYKRHRRSSIGRSFIVRLCVKISVSRCGAAARGGNPLAAKRCVAAAAVNLPIELIIVSLLIAIELFINSRIINVHGIAFAARHGRRIAVSISARAKRIAIAARQRAHRAA